MKAPHLFLFCAFLIWNSSFSQEAVVKGIILNEEQHPVSSANINVSDGRGTQTNSSGFFEVIIPANKEVEIRISHINYRNFIFRIRLAEGETYEINPVLKTSVEQISEVTLSTQKQEQLQGLTVIDPEVIRKIPGANAGVENLLKTLPGVNSNNELSTQYSVRGGSYDENLVYVNGIQVYRPFLIRSGQQEGLSFVNQDLVRKVYFSAGGFQAKYGDKLSSVLDITYRRPVGFAASFDASLLGGSISLEGTSADKKFTALGGIRYRDNSLFVEAKQTETNFHPIFADAQANLTYKFSDKLEVSFLGNISLNDYDYEPTTRQTNFGTLQDPKALIIYYNGQEEDSYRTWFGAFKTSYLVNPNFTTHFTLSTYNTREQEYFDIVAAYRMGEVNTDIGGNDFGKVEYSEGIGGQLSHARNKLDAFFVNAEHTGNLRLDAHQIDYGITYTHEDIRDRIREYEIVDSAGFSLRPPLPDFKNNEPYEPFEAPLAPFTSIRSFNETQINRIKAFVQWSKRSNWGAHEVWYNLGVRSHFWDLSAKDVSGSNQIVISPRGQFAIKPDWNKDMIFRLAGGVYHQPPFYRELRDHSGQLNPEVEAQRAIHLVIGHDYSFKLLSRPFTLTSEAYLKEMDNVNPYTLENVRIRYAAENNAEAFAYGLDLRLNGEFVPGTESWLSFGYLKTEENIDNRGYIARPTDQRLKFGLLFQDYVPKFPDLKMYLNLVYNTGLPGGSPAYADPYLYQTRLPDYRRADLGLSYLLKSEYSEENSERLKAFKEISVGFEIFNIFDTQNSITNTFVRDVYTKTQYAVPNYLSPRVYNLKIGVRL
ncbi:TonB-dependent Receptor Plug Domain [Salinimicrobium catena]|uniref:TonB-dependent Receptor Plug Domain n=1 Tax=Salinimicrobium catena TaxID=390640 RepID=A0A1H5M9C1_9FLAO|nr:TonB-dependent receptor [Salinimicrobium catena]SDL20393.1 TonB-dependent Receptor Plug Domain [Salinimicrobium catena]SEE85882.1 TonB-dependent Receptor Plug Domain [Salinimicrobium catena]